MYLAKLRIYALGAVRKNTIPNNKMLSDDELKKKERSFCQERVATVDEVEIACVSWLDNKQVVLMSIFDGSLVNIHDKN